MPASLLLSGHNRANIQAAVIFITIDAFLDSRAGADPLYPGGQAWKFGFHLLVANTQRLVSFEVSPCTNIRNAVSSYAFASQILSWRTTMLSAQVGFKNGVNASDVVAKAVSCSCGRMNQFMNLLAIQDSPTYQEEHLGTL